MEGYLQLSLLFEGFCPHSELVGNCYNPNVAFVFSQEVQLKNPRDGQLAISSSFLKKLPSSL